jgi:hypothetical protein
VAWWPCGARVLVSFPLWLWLPWVLWVVAYLPFAEADNALQRGVMLLTPLVVGAGFSTLRVDAPLIDKFRLWLNRFFWIFIAAAGVSTGLLVTGQLSATSGFAAGAITASLLAAWYAARYAGGDLRALAYWAVLAAVPVLANTRTGMVAVALTLPLTLAPLSTEKTPDCGGGAGGGGHGGFSDGAHPEQDVLFGPGHLVGCGDRCA